MPDEASSGRAGTALRAVATTQSCAAQDSRATMPESLDASTQPATNPATADQPNTDTTTETAAADSNGAGAT